MKVSNEAIAKALGGSRIYHSIDFNQTGGREANWMMVRMQEIFEEGYRTGWKDREKEFAKQLEIEDGASG